MLLYPLASKTFHVHSYEHASKEFSEAKCIDQLEKHCPVCDFEFYSFVSTDTQPVTVDSHIIPVFNSPEPFARFVIFIPYFSLRAPPSA
jgi:hypothetical protein